MNFIITTAKGYEDKLIALGQRPGEYMYPSLMEAFNALLAVGLPRTITVAQWISPDMSFFVWLDKSVEIRDPNGYEAIAVIKTVVTTRFTKSLY